MSDPSIHANKDIRRQGVQWRQKISRIAPGVWRKEGGGRAFNLVLAHDGTATESLVSAPSETWSGLWLAGYDVSYYKQNSFTLGGDMVFGAIKLRVGTIETVYVYREEVGKFVGFEGEVLNGHRYEPGVQFTLTREL